MSETYQLLKEAFHGKVLVEGRYHEKDRVFQIVNIGWTDGRERCLTYQHQPEAGWRCLDVDELFEVRLTDTLAEDIEDIFKAGCVDQLDHD
jgi:hypothetical protein